MDPTKRSNWDEREALMRLTDFKWLMSGAGWPVDLRRLLADPAYAAQCLRRGGDSRIAPLQQRCAELRGQFFPMVSPDAQVASSSSHQPTPMKDPQ
jgi:hypothetical protein